MRVYRIALHEGPVLFLREGGEEFIALLHGIPQKFSDSPEFEASFRPSLASEIFVPPYPKIVDLENTLSILVVDRLVKDKISEKNLTAIQWIEVKVKQSPERYWILNPYGDLVPLDERNSRVVYSEASKKALMIKAYAFDPPALNGRYIFRSNAVPRTLLCTEAFKRDAIENSWIELKFVPVWDESVKPFGHSPRREEVQERPDVYGPGGFHPYVEHLWPNSWSAEK